MHFKLFHRQNYRGTESAWLIRWILKISPFSSIGVLLIQKSLFLIMILAHSTLFLPYTQIIWFFREEHVFWLHFNLQEEFLNVFIEMQEKRAQQIKLDEQLARSVAAEPVAARHLRIFLHASFFSLTVIFQSVCRRSDTFSIAGLSKSENQILGLLCFN